MLVDLPSTTRRGKKESEKASYCSDAEHIQQCRVASTGVSPRTNFFFKGETMASQNEVDDMIKRIQASKGVQGDEEKRVKFSPIDRFL